MKFLSQAAASVLASSGKTESLNVIKAEKIINTSVVVIPKLCARTPYGIVLTHTINTQGYFKFSRETQDVYQTLHTTTIKSRIYTGRNFLFPIPIQF